jgi:hypothetical protein
MTIPNQWLGEHIGITEVCWMLITSTLSLGQHAESSKSWFNILILQTFELFVELCRCK